MPVLDEEGRVGELARRWRSARWTGRTFEIVFVDDGSRTARSSGCARRTSATRGSSWSAAAQLRQGGGALRRLRLSSRRASSSPWTAICRTIRRRSRASSTSSRARTSTWSRAGRRSARIRPRSAIPSLLFNWVTRKLAQVDLHDFNCGFKAYRREVLEQIALYGELHRYIPVLASRRGFRIGEIAVRHDPRARRQQVRLGPLLQGAARPDHGAVHHQVHPPAAASVRRHRAALDRRGFDQHLPGGLWLHGEPLSNRPLLLLGVC